MPKKNNLTKVYLRILSYIKPYIFLFLLATFFSLSHNVFFFSQVWVIKPFLSTLFYGEEVTEKKADESKDEFQLENLPEAAGNLGTKIDNLINKIKIKLNSLLYNEDSIKSLLNFCIFLIVVTILKNLLAYFQAISSNYYLQAIFNDIRKELFAHLQNMHLNYYNRSKLGHLVSRITNDIQQMKDAIAASIADIIRDGVQVIGLLAYLLYINWQMTLYIAVTAPLIGAFMGMIGKYLRKYSTRQQISMAQINSVLQENFSSIRVVKGFGREDYEIKRFNKEAQNFFKTNIKLNYFNKLGGPLNEINGTIVAAIVLWIGGKQVLQTGTPSPEAFIQFIVILLLLMQPLKKLSGHYAKVQRGIAAGIRVFDMLDTKPEIVDKKDAEKIETIKEKITLENVSFKYKGSEEYALKNINLEIQQGQTVALVGPSGAGKSTLADLIIRFHDVSEGKIKIDGKDIRDFKQRSLRHMTGIVTQETILFHDTIAANIAYGEEKPDRDRIIRAAKTANAWPFVEKLPDGIDSVIGDRGVMISGGERQRLAIARAVYKNPELLLFDEATSSLDTESEKLVQEAIDNLLENRTALIIAHRLSTIANAHKIIVLDNGQIVEKGTHEELLQKNGLYRELYENQFNV
ncbi:MAG: ABC transporter ATP-binding protein [Candidatus Zixiibacteriota bacterium]